MRTISSYVIVVLFVFLPALFSRDGFLIYGDDVHHQYYFYRQFFNIWLNRGVIPWWNPYFFSGAPFMASPIVNLWYPPNWLYVFIPLAFAYPLHLVFHVVFAMEGMRRVLRELGDVGEIGSWIGGLIFGFSGFFMARTWAGHVDVIAAASWMPWVVAAFARLVNSKQKTVNRKAVVLAAALFALQLLAGYQTMAFFTVITVCVVSVCQGIKDKTVMPIIRAAFSGILGIGLAAVYLVPVAEYIRQSVRTYPFPYSWISYGSWEPRSLLQLLNPFMFGNQHTYQGPPPNFVEHSAFVGVGGVVLAGIGVYKGLKSLKLLKVLNVLGLSCLIVVVFGVWVSLGPNAPVDLQYLLWKTVPFYRYLRIPTRHLILVVFGLSGLVGIGFEVFSQVLKSLKYLKLLIAGIVVLEMVWFARGFIEARPVPEVRHDKQLIAVLKADNQPYRMLQNFGVWLPQRDALDFDAVMTYGIFSATGYDPMMLRSYYEFIARASGKEGKDAILEQDVQIPYLTPASFDALDFLNVKYVMVPPSHDPFVGNERYAPVFENDIYTYRLYENKTVTPRFFPENDACGMVSVVSYDPNEIILSADLSCSTVIVSSEVMYPGWEVFVDNKKTDIIITNGTFRSVFVPEGKHTVKYRFRPVIFVYGGTISVISIGIALWVLRKN